MRVPYTANPPQPTDAAEAAIVARIAARRRPRPLQPLDLALLHSPAVADGWNGLLGAVRGAGGGAGAPTVVLAADLRELAVARVGLVNAAWHEWNAHAPLAVAAGVPAAAMDALRRWPGELVEEAAPGDDGEKEAKEDGKQTAAAETANGLRRRLEALGIDARRWAVLRYADEMTRHVRVRDETFAALRPFLGDREVVELTATIATYNCVSRFLVALDVGESNSKGPDEVH